MENENPVIDPSHELMPASPAGGPVVPAKPKFAINKNYVLIVLAVLVVAGTAVFILEKYGFFKSAEEKTAQKAIEYVNKNLIVQGKTAELGEAVSESGVIKMQVKVAEETFESYVTKDGKLFFVEGIKLDK